MTRGQLIVVLAVGLALGVGAALVGPKFARRYLPESIVGSMEGVEGKVLAKGRDGDRLLVTVETAEGATLITFKRRVPEIDLLVEVGDIITLGLARYEPFVQDPAIQRVRKRDQLAPEANPTPAPMTAPADTGTTAVPVP